MSLKHALLMSSCCLLAALPALAGESFELTDDQMDRVSAGAFLDPTNNVLVVEVDFGNKFAPLGGGSSDSGGGSGGDDSPAAETPLPTLVPGPVDSQSSDGSSNALADVETVRARDGGVSVTTDAMDSGGMSAASASIQIDAQDSRGRGRIVTNGTSASVSQAAR